MLTKKQKEILDYIVAFNRKNGHPPTLQEVAGRFKLSSKGNAQYFVNKLIDEGYLYKQKNGRIGLEETINDEVRVPFLGYIAAGHPIEPVTEPDEYISVKDILPSDNCYALRVRGNSMIDAHIMDGDIVIIENVKTASQGQKVVALIDNQEVTLKKIYFMEDKIRLMPANPDFNPIDLEPERVAVQGVVKMVIRGY